jgi:hypothetical protein
MSTAKSEKGPLILVWNEVTLNIDGQFDNVCRRTEIQSNITVGDSIMTTIIYNDAA